MKFGDCYEILERGGFVTRKGWNDVFLWMKQRANVKSEWCKDPILKMIADANGGSVEAEQTICKYSINERKVLTGWSPQQNDLAADDWDEAYVKVADGRLVIKTFHEKSKESYVGDLFNGADVFKKPNK